MKRGFTLIEILTVIILLGVVGLIVIPAVNLMIKDGKEDLYYEQMEEIKLAAEKWAYNNLKMLPYIEGDSVRITLLDLKRGGYLPLDIRDPRTEELVSNSLTVVITYQANDYVYTIEESILNTEITNDSPSIILSCNAVSYIEINDSYTGCPYVATNSKNEDIGSDVIVTYYSSGKEIASIDTSKLKTYTVEYSVTDKSNGLTTVVTQTVIIRDTVKPVITVPKETTISSSLASTYDLMNGVTVTDNSKEDIQLQINGFDASKGLKEVYYKGCDSSGNCAEAYRKITVQ